MTDYTSEITAWYEAVQFRAPSQAEITTYNAELNNGTLTAAQVQEAIIADPYTQNVVNAVIREYQAAFGRVPDQAGLSYWVNVVGANPSALSNLSVIFANSTEFNNLYGANATTPTNVALVTSLYENVLGRTPDAAGLAYWASQPLNAAQLLQYFAQSPEFITDTTNAVTAYEQQEVGANGDTAGSEPVSGNLFQTTGPVVQTAVLTTGTDKVTAQNISGDLSTFIYNGKGPTLNAGDVITGSAAASVGNTLTVTDGTPNLLGAALDAIPAGVSITNIQNIVLTTSNNASDWDTTPFSGVLTSTVTSQGTGADTVNAAATTNVTVNHENTTGSVTVTGGDTVTVDGGKTIQVGNDLVAGAAPAGAVSITQTGDGSITVEGGTTVNISAIADSTPDNFIKVGDDVANTASAAEPTGAVTITDSRNAPIDVYGGTTATITSAGGAVTAGNDASGTVYAPSGNVTITDTASVVWSNSTGSDAAIDVIGGAAISVTTNTSSVTVGDIALDALGTAALAGEEPTGDVTITDTATNNAGFADNGAPIDVYGGADISITADGSDIQVGDVVAATAPGADEVVFAPAGTVTITDTAATAWTNTAGIEDDVNVIGGTTVTITTNTGNVTVGNDLLNAAGTALLAGQNPSGDVTVTDTATNSDASVTVYGGADVNITASGIAVTVGNDGGAGLVSAPAGSITVGDTAALTYDDILNTHQADITSIGGTTVSITANSGDVTVGSISGHAGSEPSGDITILNSAAAYKDGGLPSGFDNIQTDVYGGADINIVAAAGDIGVGEFTTATDPAGTVTISESGVNTGSQYDNEIYATGGTNVTINTTGAGDGIFVGLVDLPSYNAPVTGTVAITDTYSGVQNDAVAVDGGTVVTITTTPDGGHINVGDTIPALNTAGTALADSDAFPSGVVTITNDETFGGKTTYGTAQTDVYTNGSPSVSITGTGDFDIEDVQTKIATGGANAGKPVGTSTLTSVSLTGVQSGATGSITSDALTNLTIASSALLGVSINDHTKAAALNVSLTNDGTVNLLDSIASASSYIGSLSVSSSGTALTQLNLTTPDLTALAFNNSNALAVAAGAAGDLADLTTITANGPGPGALYLGNLSSLGALTSIGGTDAGGIFVGLNPATTSFTGGSGNDTVVIHGATLGLGVTINGGGGTNTLYEDFAGGANAGTAVTLPLNISNFNVLGVDSGSSGYYDATSFTSLVAGRYSLEDGGYNGLTSDITFTNVGSTSTAGAALDLIDLNGHAITYDLKTAFGASGGGLSVTIGQDASGILPGTSSSGFLVLTGDGITSLSLSSQGAAGSNSLDVDDSTLKTVTITGDSKFLSLASGDSVVSTIDASGSSSMINVDTLSLASGGTTFIGGTGLLIAAGNAASTNAVDVFTTGSGGGDYGIGIGGSWNAALATPAYGNGSETINLGATAAKVTDTVTVYSGVVATNNGTTGGINNFKVSAANSAAASDFLGFAFGPDRVLTNQTSAVTVNTIVPTHGAADEAALNLAGISTATFNDLSYTSSNGVITFTGNGTTSLSQFSQAQLIAAAEVIVTKAAEVNGAQEVTAAFVSNGNTYVVASDVFSGDTKGGIGEDHLYSASVLELNGQASIGGFGATQAAGTIVANVDNVNAGNGGVATGTHTYNDAGYSADLLSNNAGPSVTNTFSNLAASAELDVSGGFDHGNVITTQTGSAGTNSLTVAFETNGDTIDTLTVNGDGALYINTNAQADLLIKSIVDPGNTLSTLNITGGGSLEIDGITDTALTTIDAHADTGFLNLTAAQQNGLTILGSTGGFDVTAIGTGDTISVGTSTAPASSDANTIHANGAGDTISIIGGSANSIVVSGAGDTVTVAGNTALTNVEGSAGAIGANTTVNLGTATVSETEAFVFAGSNATINFVNVASVAPGDVPGEVEVFGDTTGATSSGSYAQTTINGVTSGNLTLDLGETDVTSHWASGSTFQSQVNVATATSVANALDIAANQASVLDQQFSGGHTTVSNANTATAALKLDSATGLADWFQYGGNTYVVEAVNTSTTAAAAHTVGTHDIVVELTGLVDINHVAVNFV